MEAPSTPHALDSQDTVQCCTPSDDVSKKQATSKAAQRAQKRLMADFSAAVGSLVLEEEARISSGGAGRDPAKQRRKALRKCQKVVADSSRPLEERVAVLQERYVAAIQEQQKHDKQVAELQEQLAAARQEADTGRAELTRVSQQADKLGTLARALSADNKCLHAKAAAAANMHNTIEDIQAKITAQQLETQKVLLSRQALEQENALLKRQLVSTGSVLDELRQQQEARLNALADKLKEQDAAMQQTQQAHAAMSSLIAENKVLTLRAAAADEMKVRMDLMEKLLAESQSQCEQYGKQYREVQSTLKAASSLTQTVDKMQRQSKEQQKITTNLLQERQVLAQQVQVLTQQGREQGDKLRRAQAQKQRLEALCRALQQGCAGSEGGAGGDAGETALSAALPGDDSGVAAAAAEEAVCQDEDNSCGQQQAAASRAESSDDA